LACLKEVAELIDMQADNPIVWDLLKLIVRLASKILNNEYQYSWYDHWCKTRELSLLIHISRLDALFNDKLIEFGMPVNSKALLILNPRTEDERRISLNANEIQNIFTNDLKDKIKFQIACRYTEGASDLPGGKYNGNSFTTQGKWGEHSVITIAVQLLEPLLRDELTDAER
jgi:hypothetical protein